MDCKQCAGKWLVFFLTILFGLGVIISTFSPDWIIIKQADPKDANAVIEVAVGPFYSAFRSCKQAAGSDDDVAACSDWQIQTVSYSDCEDLGDDVPDFEKLCRHLLTWRTTGIICLLLTLAGGGLVLAATCCEVVTCGSCGNSLTCLSNVLFSLEVALSIVTWSFAISSLSLMNRAPSVLEMWYGWAFWLFVVFGTVVGALAAWMADWAAEDSFIRRCLGCGGSHEKDERGEPLMGA